MTRLIQLIDEVERFVGLVVEPHVRLLEDVETYSVYSLAQKAIATGTPLSALVQRYATGALLEYDAIYRGTSPLKLLPPIDHPVEPARCLVSGTGLTHIGSARDRNAMHGQPAAATAANMTDSMRMFQSGLDGGRPGEGRIGVAPEWFYKGTGTMVRAHGEPLDVPSYAEDGGEEAELAGVYMIDGYGNPYRIGMTAGNEFSDHRFERRNYLHLAGSKLRTCAIGPELVIDPAFEGVSVPGEVSIERGSNVLWQKAIASGESEMSHSLQNLEHHHFKFEAHRRPGDVHVHFFGAHSLSFGEGVTLEDGDVMVVWFDGFGRALRNVVRVASPDDRPITCQTLG